MTSEWATKNTYKYAEWAKNDANFLSPVEGQLWLRSQGQSQSPELRGRGEM